MIRVFHITSIKNNEWRSNEAGNKRLIAVKSIHWALMVDIMCMPSSKNIQFEKMNLIRYMENAMLAYIRLTNKKIYCDHHLWWLFIHYLYKVSFCWRRVRTLKCYYNIVWFFFHEASFMRFESLCSHAPWFFCLILRKNVIISG